MGHRDFEDEDIRNAVEQLRALVCRGRSPREALAGDRWMPEELKRIALERYEEQLNQVRRIEDPGALVDRRAKGDAWYTPSEDDKLFHALMGRLRDKGMPSTALDVLDDSSTVVLNDMRPPGSARIDTRGLVLGYVQSGKTTSFMTVAAKAADVGYRLVIVLSGITNNLRKQTQDRLEEDLIGAGEDQHRWFRLTSSDFDFQGDRNAGTILGSDDKRALAVVKKNPATLRKLLKWLRDAGQTAQNCPILVIDDEADQASINIAKPGQVSTINQLIREIIAFPKAAYIAYTATPFANLLIDIKDDDDLYPRDFIRSLKPGEGYFGAEQLFGRALLDHEEGDPDDGLPVIRTIPDGDVDGVRPPKGVAVEDWDVNLPDSLDQALDWFLLATAVRRMRGDAHKHSSMLVHTSMKTAVQEAMAEALEGRLALRQRQIASGDEEAMEALKGLWEGEYAILPPVDGASWDAVAEQLRGVAEDCRIVVDNYRSDRRLEYSEDEPGVLVAVGGNTLSRGLTLEGLVASYFVRASTTYDTLLQMGRWFGYRKGYEDLVRVWMTEELESWFRDLALVEAEIREAIEDMAAQDRTPRELPIAIRRHPAMSVTSAARMQHAQTTRISYAGQREQTILFDVKDAEELRRNWQAGEELVRSARRAPGVEEAHDPSGKAQILLRDVPHRMVRQFLSSYSFHPDSRRLRPELLLKYFDEAKADLAHWDVFVMGRRNGDEAVFADGGVTLIERSRVNVDVRGANIKSLAGSQDRGVGIDRETLATLDPSAGQMDRQIRDLRESRGDNPLIGLYPINKDSRPASSESVDRSGGRERRRLPLEAVDHTLGVVLFFPEAEGPTHTVDYVAAGVPEELDFQAAYLEELDEIEAEEGAE